MSFSKFNKIIPPKDRFWADPNVIYKNGKYFIFFEEFYYSEKYGHISVIEIDKDGKYSTPKIILKQNYHLSYPSFFKFNDELFFIHGSIKESSSCIDLFKCIEFPYKWEFYDTLIDNIVVCDTTMFFHNGKWWIFACAANVDGTSNSSELVLYYSNNPLSKKWIPHPKNPIVSDIQNARPAGSFFESNNKIIRPGQNCLNIYGHGFSFNEITKLNETEYEERQLESFEPWNGDIIGLHTFNRVHDCIVIDVRIKRNRFK